MARYSRADAAQGKAQGHRVRACRSLTRRLDIRPDDDARCGRKCVEIIPAGQPVRAGLDGVFGLFQELADVPDALVDRLGPDAGQDGDGDLRLPMRSGTICLFWSA